MQIYHALYTKAMRPNYMHLTFILLYFISTLYHKHLHNCIFFKTFCVVNCSCIDLFIWDDTVSFASKEESI